MLSVNLSDLLFSMINFIILLVALYFLLYKRLVVFMDNRQKEIKDSLDAASDAREEAKNLSETLAAETAAARKEGQAIIAAAQKSAQEAKNKIIQEAMEESSALAAKAKAEIHREQEQALADIKKEIANLVVKATEKLLDENLDQEKQAKLVEKYMQEAGFEK